MSGLILSQKLTTAECNEQARRLFCLLGQRNRMLILEAIAFQNGQRTGELAEATDNDDNNVIYHLCKLHKGGLVEPSPSGWVLHPLATKVITNAFSHVFGALQIDTTTVPSLGQAERIDRLECYYRALRSESSINITRFLASQKGEVGQRQLTGIARITQAATSFSIKQLRAGGVIVATKSSGLKRDEGDRTVYVLTDYRPVLVETLRLLGLNDSQITQAQVVRRN